MLRFTWFYLQSVLAVETAMLAVANKNKKRFSGAWNPSTAVLAVRRCSGRINSGAPIVRDGPHGHSAPNYGMAHTT